MKSSSINQKLNLTKAICREKDKALKHAFKKNFIVYIDRLFLDM